MFLIMNPLTFFLLCSSVFSFWFTVPFAFSSRPVYVASHVRTRLARPWHVLYTFYTRPARLEPICWFFPRLFLTLSHLPLTWFLEILFKLFTVVWFCCTFLTPCSTYDTLKTHCCTLWTRCCTLWTRCCTSYTRSPRICWILSSSLTLSRFLPLTWFLEILFKLFTVVWFCCTFLTPCSTSATLLHVLHTYATLLHILHTRTPRCYTSYTHVRHV